MTETFGPSSPTRPPRVARSAGAAFGSLGWMPFLSITTSSASLPDRNLPDSNRAGSSRLAGGSLSSDREYSSGLLRGWPARSTRTVLDAHRRPDPAVPRRWSRHRDGVEGAGRQAQPCREARRGDLWWVSEGPGGRRLLRRVSADPDPARAAVRAGAEWSDHAQRATVQATIEPELGLVVRVIGDRGDLAGAAAPASRVRSRGSHRRSRRRARST